MLSKTKDPEGVSKDDPFSVLLVNLQCDSGCSRGHLSARSSLQAIRTTMSPTTKLCMEAWLRVASVPYHTKMATAARGRLEGSNIYGYLWI